MVGLFCYAFFVFLVYHIHMFRSDSYQNTGLNPPQDGVPPLRDAIGRAFQRDRILAADPYLIPTSEDKGRAAQNPYRTRGPYAIVSRHS